MGATNSQDQFDRDLAALNISRSDYNALIRQEARDRQAEIQNDLNYKSGRIKLKESSKYQNKLFDVRERSLFNEMNTQNVDDWKQTRELEQKQVRQNYELKQREQQEMIYLQRHQEEIRERERNQQVELVKRHKQLRQAEEAELKELTRHHYQIRLMEQQKLLKELDQQKKLTALSEMNVQKLYKDKNTL